MEKRAEETFELSLLLAYYGTFLTQRQQQLLSLSVDQDMSLAEIAEAEGISRQGVLDALARARTQLRQMENKLTLVSRSMRTGQGLRRLSDAISALDIPAPQKEQLLLETSALQKIWED